MKRLVCVVFSVVMVLVLLTGCSGSDADIKKYCSGGLYGGSNPYVSSSVSSAVSSATSSAMQQSMVDYSDISLSFVGSVGQSATIQWAFKNVGTEPINGFAIKSKDLGSKNFSILSVSDNPKINKDLIQSFTWDKVVQPGETVQVSIELAPMKSMSNKKVDLELFDMNDMAMMRGSNYAIVTALFNVK